MRQLMLAAIAFLIGASSSLAQGHMGTPQEQQACTAILPEAVGRRQRGSAMFAAKSHEAEQGLPECIPEPRKVTGEWRRRLPQRASGITWQTGNIFDLIRPRSVAWSI
jgi:hypothetical protein